LLLRIGIEVNKLNNSIKEKPMVGIWQIFMLVLSLYVLIALFMQSAFNISEQSSNLLNHIDTIICFIFIGDFTYQLISSKNRLGYLKWGWIDLVSSIPNLSFFRIGRAARIIRVLRLLRGIRSAKLIIKQLYLNRAKNAIVAVALISFVMVIFASIAILNFENVEGANIKNANDALWWAFVTVTTVGYGDKYPITDSGRVIAALLMITGVGLFGTFTGFVASLFLTSGEKEQTNEINELYAKLSEIEAKLDRLENR
jgi:voltage-gated potassium channel